jgi:transcriptional regulator with XRE-family HTH domain
MDGSGIGKRLQSIRRSQMWTQGRLAEEAGVSPTTVSGIETGRIVRPHFGTLSKLARALEVDPHMLSSSSKEPSGSEDPAFPSLQWAQSAEEGEFERELEEASLEGLKTLARELKEERERLQRLYGEFPEGSEQRRYLKRQIREVFAQSGSIATSMMFSGKGAKAHTDDHKEVAEEPRREGV